MSGPTHAALDDIANDRVRLLTIIAMSAPTITERGYGSYWDTEVRPGDLVRCQTQRTPNRWCFAWYEGSGKDEALGGAEYHDLRVLGGDERTRMFNESVMALRRPLFPLLEGLEWQTYVLIRRAFSDVACSYLCRFRDADFAIDDRIVTVTIRPHGAVLGGNRLATAPPAVVYPYGDGFDRAAFVELLDEATPTAEAWRTIWSVPRDAT